MRKTLTYSSFVITSLLVILAFITATTYIQLGIAVVIYPFIAYFAYRLFTVRSVKAPTASLQPPQAAPSQQTEVKPIKTQTGDISIADIDKRAFLKVIGATGISFFLFSLLNRRTDALFFGRSSGPGISTLSDGSGKKIDPSERQPMDGYVISEIDEGLIAYYGFTNNDAVWYIMKENPDEGSFRYIKGEADFSSNWVSRENLDYDYFHNVF